MGHGHYIESIGNEDCEMLAVFNSGDYQEVSLSQWLSSNPSYLLQTNLGLSADIVKGLRKKEDLFSDPSELASPQK
jgi:oxalate decarboxylase